MTDIFVSYARADRDRVEPVVRILEALGWSVWWDAKINPGVEFDQEIGSELGEAKCVLVVWSGASVESHWVRGEAREGLKRGVALPILLDDSAPPIDFRTLHAIDLSRWKGGADEDGIVQLRDSIARLLKASPNPSVLNSLAQAQRRTKTTRRLKIVSAVLAAVLILCIAFNFHAIPRAFDMLGGIVQAMFAKDLFSTADARRFSERLGLIEGANESNYVQYKNQTVLDAWAAAQLIAGTNPNPDVDRALFQTAIEPGFDRTCGCWSPIDGGQQAAPTAWVILASAMRKRAIVPEVLESVLGHQDGTGAWPSYFDAKNAETSESTYATLLITLALYEYRNALPVDADTGVRMDNAIARAGGWLFLHRPTAGNAWSDYPNLPIGPSTMQGGIRSQGISALAVYTFLRVFHDPRAKLILKTWVAHLGPGVAFDYVENAATFIEAPAGRAHHDFASYIVTAWQLAALMKGYSSLSFWERVRAQWFLSDDLTRWSVDPAAMQTAWVLGESVYALRAAGAPPPVQSAGR